MSVDLVAIAKNEEQFIVEWVAHYIALGFDNIIIYDDQSDDKTADVVRKISEKYPVTLRTCPGDCQMSPQLWAYENAISQAQKYTSSWIAFFDIDEFLVPLDRRITVSKFLYSLPPDVAAVGFNWLTFGSGGRLEHNYDLVRDAFRSGAERSWGNNRHIKTIVRAKSVKKMGIHHCVLKEGKYIHPDGGELTMSGKPGLSDRIEHSLFQLNHYQCKSMEDFMLKIARGRAGKKRTDPTRIRDNPEAFFKKLDRNDCTYHEIDIISQRFEKVLHGIRETIGCM